MFILRRTSALLVALHMGRELVFMRKQLMKLQREASAQPTSMFCFFQFLRQSEVLLTFFIRYGNALVHFDPAAESRLRLKIDLYIVPTVSLLYLFCFIDRANIGNAKLAGFEKDLGLKGYDYNAVLSVFYISYIIFEIPSNMLCKVLGPGYYIPAISLGFGIMSIVTAFVHNFSQAAAVRFILGKYLVSIGLSH